MNNTTTEGYMHTIYVELTNEEYTSLFYKYKQTNLINQNFIMYANNSVFVLGTDTKPVNKKFSYKFETWNIEDDNTLNFTMNTIPVCYNIDKFTNRYVSKEVDFTKTSLRLVANGCWLYEDNFNTVFIGQTLRSNTTKPLTLSTKDRFMRTESTYTTRESAISRSIDDNTHMCATYFLMNKVSSTSQYLYTEIQIEEFLKQHNLEYLNDNELC